MALGPNISRVLDKLTQDMPAGFKVMHFKHRPHGVKRDGTAVPANFECKLVNNAGITKTGFGRDELSAGQAACKAADDDAQVS